MKENKIQKVCIFLLIPLFLVVVLIPLTNASADIGPTRRSGLFLISPHCPHSRR